MKKILKFIKDFIKAVFWFSFSKLAKFIPINTALKLGSLIGKFKYYISRRKNKIFAKLIKDMLNINDNQNLNKIIKRSYEISVLNLIETFYFPYLNNIDIEKFIEAQGLEFIDNEIKNNKGVILLLAHFGANQLCMAGLGYRNYKIYQLGSTPFDWHKLTGIKLSKLERFVFNIKFNLEKHLPANFIYLENPTRRLIEILKKGNIVIMAFDGRAGSKWMKIPFFNKIMNISTGPFNLSRLTNTKILPIFMIRKPDNFHKMVILEPLKYKWDKNIPKEVNLKNYAIEFAKILENFVKKYPDHYANLIFEAIKRAPYDKIPLFENLNLN